MISASGGFFVPALAAFLYRSHVMTHHPHKSKTTKDEWAGKIVTLPLPPSLGLIILAVSSFVCGGAAAQGTAFTITPGIGHDRFTETFFLEDSTSVTLDSLERIDRKSVV